MRKRAQEKIEEIMWIAFDQAAAILMSEFKLLIQTNPTRYSRFVLAVGWGPTLFDTNGKIVRDKDCCTRARRLLAYAYEFYDRNGADNRQVTA